MVISKIVKNCIEINKVTVGLILPLQMRQRLELEIIQLNYRNLDQL